VRTLQSGPEWCDFLAEGEKVHEQDGAKREKHEQR